MNIETTGIGEVQEQAASSQIRDKNVIGKLALGGLGLACITAGLAVSTIETAEAAIHLVSNAL